MIVFLQLTTAGIDSGPFDLYSNLNSFSEPFEENVSRASLVAGYSTTVPDNAIIVRITSKEDCISSVDITLRDVECNLEGYTGEITTTSTSTTSTTSTTTTICIRPTGLTIGNLIFYIKPIESSNTRDFKNTSVADACDAFNYFRTEYDPLIGGGGVGFYQMEYSQLQINEPLYLNDNIYNPSTNCILVENGYYWFQPNNIGIFTYFANTNPINIVTVTNGLISAIDSCTYVP
jgi:hypothetical protein